MDILQTVLIALSLCADCFAVSLCSSVTIKELKSGNLLRIALIFAFIQSLLLLMGWSFGNLIAGFVSSASKAVGFILLIYVGGSMLVSGIKDDCEVRNLNGWFNVVLGGVATSIDALAVGVSQSMAGEPWRGFLPLLLSVFAVTALSVAAGIRCGRTIGCRIGRWAEIAGGAVLVGIGFMILLK